MSSISYASTRVPFNVLACVASSFPTADIAGIATGVGRALIGNDACAEENIGSDDFAGDVSGVEEEPRLRGVLLNSTAFNAPMGDKVLPVLLLCILLRSSSASRSSWDIRLFRLGSECINFHNTIIFIAVIPDSLPLVFALEWVRNNAVRSDFPTARAWDIRVHISVAFRLVIKYSHISIW